MLLLPLLLQAAAVAAADSDRPAAVTIRCMLPPTPLLLLLHAAPT
jgi:hypothetical protein